MTTATSFGDAPGQGADVNRNVNIDFSSDVSGFTSGVNQATQAVQQLTGALTGAARQADSLSRAVGTKLAHFTFGDFAALGTAAGVAARFEHQLGTLNATAAITGTSMNAMKQQLSGVFSQFPVWREQVVQLATAISNMGITKPADVGKLTGSYTKLGAATGEDSTSLAASGIGLARQMGNMDASKIDKYNNSLVTLSKTAGVSAQSITDFASALAPFARQAGIGEAAVLGISTAFQKAGADGQVAANAFNSLLSTITTLKQSGGDVSKYSSFLGMSQTQFRALSPQEAATRTFETVGQGGNRANAFAQDLGGIRTVGAVQRVAQTGDLRSMVNLSQANAQNTNNLDKSSSAAFDGLTNAMTSLRNDFTELGEIIGGPLLTPLKDLAQVAGKLVSGLNTVLKALGPITPALGVVAGAAAIPASFGLAHMALGGALSVGRSVFGKNAGWKAAAQAGRGVSQAMAADPNLSEDDALAATEMGQRYSDKKLPWVARTAFRVGRGSTSGGAGSPSLFEKFLQSPTWQNLQSGYQAAKGTPAGTAIAGVAAGGKAQALTLQQLVHAQMATAAGIAPAQASQMTSTQLMRAQMASLAGVQPGQPPGGMLGNLAKLAGQGTAWVAEQQYLPLTEQNQRWQQRPAYRREMGENVTPEGGPAGRIKSALVTAGPNSAAAIMQTLAAALRGAANKIPEDAALGGQVVKGGLHVASGLGRVGGLISRGAGMLADVATGPVGLAAAVGLPIIGSLFSHANDQQQKRMDAINAPGDMSKMDQQLDSTSSNLAKFSDSVAAATDKLAALAGTPLANVTTVTTEDKNAALDKNYKPTTSIADVIAASGGKGAKDDVLKKNIEAYIATLGVQAPDMKGDRGTVIKQDTLAGLGADRSALVESIMKDVVKTQNAPGGFTGAMNNNALGNVLNSATPDQWTKIFKGAVEGLQGATQNAGEAGALPGIAGAVQIGSQGTAARGPDQAARIQSYVDQMSKYYSIDPKELQSAMDAEAKKQGTSKFITQPGMATGDQSKPGVRPLPGALAQPPGGAGQPIQPQTGVVSPYGSASDAAKVNAAAIADTAGGKAYMAAHNISRDQFIDASVNGTPLPNPVTTNQDLATLRTMGSAGRGLAGQTAVQGMVDRPGSAGQAALATNAMLASAMKSAGGIQGSGGTAQQAANDLRTIAQTVGGPLGDVATAAAAAADQLFKISQITMTPAQFNLQTVQGAQAANQALTPDSSGDQIAAASAKTGDAQTAINDQTSRNRQMMTTVKAFNVQMQRSTEDYNTQTAYSNEAFGLQQQRTADSYGRAVMRTNRDYATQTARAEAQNYLQRSRQTEEFGIQQQRATQQYELGVTREVAAAALAQSRAQQQYNTENTREHEAYSLQVNRETEQYNKDRLREQQDYQTESARSNAAYHLSVARENEDFNTQQQQAQQDYNTSKTRQLEHYQTQVARSERDFKISQQRAADQFNLQLKRQAEQEAQNIYDPWSRVQRKATVSAGSLLKNLTTQNADIAKQIAELAEAKKLGVSEQTIQELDLSNPANAQQLDSLIKTLKRDPGLIGKINQQVATRVDSTKALTQTNDNLAYKNQVEDFATQNKNAIADFQKSMKDGAADLATSMKESYEDFVKQTDRARLAEQKSLKRGEEDHRIQMTQSAEDYHKNMLREAQDFATSILQGAQDFRTSLKHESEDFATQTKNAAQDLLIQLQQGGVDFATQMKNSVDDFTREMANAETDFELAQSNAAADHKTTLADMKTDFGVTMAQAATDHQTALTQMTTAYQQQQQRAGEDLTTTFSTYTGGLNDSIIQMTQIATSQMQQYAPGAATAYLQAIIDAANVAGAAIGLPNSGVILGQPSAAPGSGTGTGWQQQPGGPGNGVPNGGGNPAGAASPGGGGGGGKGPTAYATGGISLNAQLALVSEAGPELHLPLDTSGEAFLAKMMSRTMANALVKAGKGAAVGAKDWRASGYAAAGQANKSVDMQPQDKAFFTSLAQRAMQNATVIGKQLLNVEHQSQSVLAAAIVKSTAAIVHAIHTEEVATRSVMQKTDNSMSFAGAQFKVEASNPNALMKQLQAAAKLKKLTSPVKH